jgi:excisionase family DNA binding protein
LICGVCISDFREGCKPQISAGFVNRTTQRRSCAIWDVSRRVAASKETFMEPIAISINATARALSVGRSSIYKLIHRGKLDALKIGTRTLVTTESIARLTAQQRKS